MRNIFISLALILLISGSLMGQTDSCAEQTIGDLNEDGVVDSLDLDYLKKYFWGTGPAPNNISNADINGDCYLYYDDITYLEYFLNNSGATIAECTCLDPDTCYFQERGNFDNSGGSTIDVSDLVAFADAYSSKNYPLPLHIYDFDRNCKIELVNDTYYFDGFQMISIVGQPVDYESCGCISPLICDDWKPGDLNGDDLINQDDVDELEAYISGNGSTPLRLTGTDVNSDRKLTPDDIQYLDNYLNYDGPDPAECRSAYVDTLEFQYPGDVNADGVIDQADVVYLTDFIYNKGPLPPFKCNGDANGDCIISIDDIAAIENYIGGSGSLVNYTCLSPALECTGIDPGDINSDCIIDSTDLSILRDYLFDQVPIGYGYINADVDGNCTVDYRDLICLNRFIVYGDGCRADTTCDNPDLTKKSFCCFGQTGNVDYDLLDNVDIADLLYLVNYMYSSFGEPLRCVEEANVDGIATQPDISDLLFFVDYMFLPDAPAPASCPY